LEFSTEILLLLFIVALCAGFLDTLAGGGGLITIPALVLSGVPPLAALGTNKLQACVGVATSSFLLFKRGKIQWLELRMLMLTAFIGSVVGTVFIQFVDASVLGFVIPCVLVIIAVYFIAAPYLKLEGAGPRLSEPVYRKTVVPVIGAYDGMFGPGTGSFFALAGVSLRGLELIRATAMAKPLNFSTNLASLLVFLLAGQVLWLVGLVMMVGQALGAWAGSHYLYKVNPAVLRIIIVTVCLLMLGRYLIQRLGG
jgi:uncharacterized membrane protein YfcA